MRTVFVSTLLVFCMWLLPQATADAQPKESVSDIILKYATTGNFSALQKLKDAPLAKDEELMVSALLQEDGQVARAMYEQFLKLYPTSPLASLSQSRIMEYNAALQKSQSGLVPTPKKSPETRLPTDIRYTLQFGSFSTIENAQRFAKSFPKNVRIKILSVDSEYGQKLHKVRWDGYRMTREEIDSVATKIPFDSFVVEDR
ncbi:MAG: hypothetical protein HGB19_14715 [Chlorobiales bacterium]|nr:hypothetical protein [Chlorobiales bacterium]